MVVLYCPYPERHRFWGSYGGWKRITVGCSSTISGRATPTPSMLSTVRRVGDHWSGRISGW